MPVAGVCRYGGCPAGGEKFMLTGFYTAFSPACFSLLGLWLVIIQIKPDAWINLARKKQAYAVTLFFAAPGTMRFSQQGRIWQT
jgi:hypothetical protein